MLNYLLAALCIALAGAADGINQVLQYRYYGFKKRFPHLKDWYWNPDESWMRKYKDNNPIQGEKFWGSTTIFVGITDGYHLTRLLEHLFLAMTIIFAVHLNVENWGASVIVGVVGWIINRIVFSIVFRAF